MYNKFDRKTEIKKQMEIYKAEQQSYEKEIRKNPNYKIVYHNNYYHL